MILLPGGTKLGFVYILECEGGTFYVGYATKLHRRLVKHFNGTGAIFTQLCKPKCLLAYMPANIEDENRTAEFWRKWHPGKVVGGELTRLEYFRNMLKAKPKPKRDNRSWRSIKKR